MSVSFPGLQGVGGGSGKGDSTANTAILAITAYNHQPEYARQVIYYCVAVLGLATVFHLHTLYRSYRPPPAAKPDAKTSPLHKIAAIARMVTYRQPFARFGFPPLVVIALFLVTIAFLLAQILREKPWYAPTRTLVAPPIAVRSGMMVLALLPFLVALAGKVNFVTMLTGIPHERLSVVHRWLGYVAFGLVLAHALPMLLQPYWDGGSAGFKTWFYRKGSVELTGPPGFGIFFGICVLSNPIIRHRFFNIFYRLHILMYIAFIGLLFWHTDNLLFSWDYLYATVAVWGASLVLRVGWKWQATRLHRTPIRGFEARATAFPGELTRLAVHVPPELRWSPGQHCWVRITDLSILQQHPFTITSLPKSQSSTDSNTVTSSTTAREKTTNDDAITPVRPVTSLEESTENEMVFMIRAERGLTKTLHSKVLESQGTEMRVHIDGPYGGVPFDLPASYDTLIFVAGGGGIGGCIPHIVDASKRMQADGVRVTSLRVVWVIRSASHLVWVKRELVAAKAAAAEEGRKVTVDVYVTGGRSEEKTVGDADEGASMGGLSVHSGRPALEDLLPSFVEGRRTFIFGCGPGRMRASLGTAASSAQSKVLRGEADVVALRTETFGW